MSDNPIIAIRIVVHGKVQGVGYRAWVEGRARKFGLEGWVRNRRDDTVEALFAGPQAAVDTMIADCHRGPAAARVTQIERTEAAPGALAQRRGAERFSVLDTL